MINPYKKMKPYESDVLIEKAFYRASKSAKNIPASDKRVKEKEKVRITTFSKILIDKLKEYLKQFRDLKEDKYTELRRIYISDEELKEHILNLVALKNKLYDLRDKYLRKLENDKTKEEMRKTRKEFLGRCARYFKKYKKSLDKLNEIIKIMKKYPDFREKKTIILTGLPNVGKSSLISKLTKAKPEIKNYPFTTKTLITGSIEGKVQLIDTPGLLDRDKKNIIEKNAIYALDVLGDEILYLFDAAEIGGSYEEQINLYNRIKKMFPNKKIIKVVNKIDLNKNHKFKEICDFEISCETGEGLEKLKKFLKGDE